MLQTFEFPAQVHGALALSPDGKTVAGGDCMADAAAVRALVASSSLPHQD